MVSRKNIKYKMQQDAKCVPHYGIRKLSIGVASVLLGTVFYMQNGTVHADVNSTVSTGNDNVNVVNKDSGTSGSAVASSTSTGVDLTNSGVGSVDSASSVVSAGDATNLAASSQVSGSPVEGATKQVNNSDWVASEPEGATPASQVNVDTDNSISSLPPASHHQVSADGGNPSNEQLSTNLSLSVNQNSNFNFSSLLASKVALTGSNNAVNGGFDEATWGKLDVNAWKGSVQGDYYQLTDYTGDANHVIVPNEADFAKAGISTAGKQVGVTSELMHRIFRDKTTAQDATVAFSKTDNKMVKAVNADWSNTWGRANEYVNGLSISSKGKLTKFDGTNLDVSNVINMSYMFYANQLSDLSSLANWKVDKTSMNSMFCENRIIDLSPLASWKVDNVKDMTWMFANNQISDLSPLASWKVDNVKYMSWMFYGNQISDLSPLASWKVDNVTNMSNMFEFNQISDLSPLTNWKVDNVTNMHYMFSDNHISDLSPLTNWKVDNVTNMSGMFYNNRIIDLSPLTNWKVDNVKDMSWMFANNRIIDLSPLASWKVDNVTNMSGMFANNQIIDLSPLASWKVDNVTNMSEMFESNQKISDLSPLTNWKVDNAKDMSWMFANNQISDLSPLASWKVDNVTNMRNMFETNQISDLSPLTNWKVDNVTNMGCMFYNNRIIDLSPLTNWKVDNVTNMSGMFYNNRIIDLSPLASWKVDNVTNMSNMFESNQISDLSPLTNWKVDNVTNMSGMFYNNRIIDLSPLTNWKVDNVTNMSGMFYNNRIIDLSPLASWKVDNVTNMSNMFESNQISDLSPLTNWKVDNVTNMSEMFDYNYSSQTKNLQATRVINFFYPAGYTGKKQDPVTQTVNVPQKVKVELTTKDSKPSNNILDWVTKTETPETPAPVYFKDYTVPAIKGLLEPDKTVISKQQADVTKPINVTVTYKLVESDTNDAFALDSKNGLHEHANVNDNGGYDTDFWGMLDVSKFTTVTNGDNLEITGYTGDASKVIIPNIADFEINNLDQGAKQVTISSSVMRKLAKNATRIGLSKTNNQKVVASDAIWQDAFGGMTNEPNTDSNANGGMWVYNPNLTVMDLHNLDTTNITDMSAMFNGGRNLNVVGDLSQWNVANVVSMKVMFQRASSLTDIGNLDNWNTSNVTDMSYMFSNASALTNIGDLSKWQTGKVIDMQHMFANATSLTNIGNLDNWDTSNVTNMSWMFGTDSGNQLRLTSIGDLSKWQTGNVTDMNSMFANATCLTSIGDLSKWNTSKVTDMNSMFYNATNLTNIGDLSKWDTSKVTDMSWMFGNAINLTNIGNLDSWDTSKVTNMNSMFYNVTHLINIGDLSKWDTSKVTNMSCMFMSANTLRRLNISNWNLTKLANKDAMKYMFANDTDLTIIVNDLVLPVWYQNEINDADYFWNHHIAVITNVPELIRATGDIDILKIDNQYASRSIFYDSKGSSDAIQVLKDANQAYIKQYQNDHPGYILNLAADVDQTDPIALANADFISAPREVQFTIAYYDLTGKIVNSTTSTHKVGDTVSISPVVPDNYVLANGQLGMNYLMRWGLNEADFLVEPKVTMTTQTKTVSRTITVQTPDGQTNNVVQTVTFVRNSYLNQVTKQTTYLPWSFGGQYQFSGYRPKPIDGYTADVVPAVIVTPDSLDTTANVVYHKVPVVYEIDYRLANGTVVKNVSATPERDGTIHLTAPQGYRLLTTVPDVQVGYSSQKLSVLVLPNEQTYTAYSALPSVVTEPLTKTVTRTVKITLPNGHVRTVKQSVKFERTATVAANGKIAYSNWTGVGQTSFDRLFVPKRRGYRLVMTNNQDQTLIGVNQMMVDPMMDNVVINVKYVK